MKRTLRFLHQLPFEDRHIWLYSSEALSSENRPAFYLMGLKAITNVLTCSFPYPKLKNKPELESILQQLTELGGDEELGTQAYEDWCLINRVPTAEQLPRLCSWLKDNLNSSHYPVRRAVCTVLPYLIKHIDGQTVEQDFLPKLMGDLEYYLEPENSLVHRVDHLRYQAMSAISWMVVWLILQLRTTIFSENNYLTFQILQYFAPLLLPHTAGRPKLEQAEQSALILATWLKSDHANAQLIAIALAPWVFQQIQKATPSTGYRYALKYLPYTLCLMQPKEMSVLLPQLVQNFDSDDRALSQATIKRFSSSWPRAAASNTVHRSESVNLFISWAI